MLRSSGLNETSLKSRQEQLIKEGSVRSVFGVATNVPFGTKNTLVRVEGTFL